MNDYLTAAFLGLAGAALLLLRRKFGELLADSYYSTWGIRSGEQVARAAEFMAALVGVFLIVVAILKAVK